ncbi:uncharacterized protein LOC113767119 isoform X1 [Coffea eugenioides]|uniref:uncharacterized protein LOC113764075 isoform X1 n=1 Tax=Coffea eugenioides TaxID=49369 RepID=UPI000F607A0B|nr:uncharacterized protein LOC113764075 isoform X1 [Coffea eugenioides]XP_027167097.1 uncharacterized protein LOC113767119 isoform X1 [Coffea eugenioides]
MGQIFHLNLEYWFNFADSDGDSRLTGNDAMKIFAMSNLSRPELKQLSWEHCWLLWSLFWALIRSWHPSILLHFWLVPTGWFFCHSCFLIRYYCSQGFAFTFFMLLNLFKFMPYVALNL